MITVAARFTSARVCAISSPLEKTVQVQVAPPPGPDFSLTLSPTAEEPAACKGAQRDSPTTVTADFSYAVIWRKAVPGLVFTDPEVSSSAPAAASCSAARPRKLTNVLNKVTGVRHACCCCSMTVAMTLGTCAL